MQYKTTIKAEEVIVNKAIYPFKLQEILFNRFHTDVVITNIEEVKRNTLKIVENTEEKTIDVIIDYDLILDSEMAEDLYRLDERIEVGL